MIRTVSLAVGLLLVQNSWVFEQPGHAPVYVYEQGNGGYTVQEQGKLPEYVYPVPGGEKLPDLKVVPQFRYNRPLSADSGAVPGYDYDEEGPND